MQKDEQDGLQAPRRHDTPRVHNTSHGGNLGHDNATDHEDRERRDDVALQGPTGCPHEQEGPTEHQRRRTPHGQLVTV